MIYIFIWKLCCRKEKVVQLIQQNKRNSETRYERAFYHHQQELNWITELNLLDREVERKAQGNLQGKMKAAWYLVKQNGCRATTTRQAAWTYLVKKVKNKVYFKRSLYKTATPGQAAWTYLALTHHASLLLLCSFQALVYIYNPPFIPFKI